MGPLNPRNIIHRLKGGSLATIGYRLVAWGTAHRAPPRSEARGGAAIARRRLSGLNIGAVALDDRSFRRLLEKERIRAERSGAPFSLVTFHRDVDESFVRRLRDRLRVPDETGILDGRIAVLLPDTSHEGAARVAEDVCEDLEVERRRDAYTIAEYPESDECRPREGRVVGTRVEESPRQMALFVQPLPRWKRCVDVAGALFGLIVLSPLLLLTAIVVRATSPGPALFTQQRHGLGGRPFTIYKFRTMCVDAEQAKSALRSLSEQDGPAFKLRNDPRVTPVGRLLRKSCIDELPQLWNVLIGDMSLVGPRPLPCDESAKCQVWERRRLHVTPGLTCVWQVHGGSHVSFPDWMRMDIRYINRRSIAHDFALIWRTLVAVLLHRASH